MLGGADNTNGELPSYITGANILPHQMIKISASDPPVYCRGGCGHMRLTPNP